MSLDIILIGGGGHCKSCIDVIETEKKFRIAGIVDTIEKLNSRVLDYAVIGTDEDLPSLISSCRFFLVSIGHIKDAVKRIERFDLVRRLGGEFPIISSPKAHVSRHASIGAGTIVMHGALVNAGASVGQNCIINSGAVIEHDVVVGDHCHISTGAIINGGAKIGEGTFLGSRSTARESIEIGAYSIIGAGATLMGSVNPRTIVKA
jgi:sugar O-acyltransferase (sialic acid O-acetyltransferase NeuD family)